MSMRLYQVEKLVEKHEQMRFEQEASFFDYIRSGCARMLAETIMRDASRYMRIDPAKDDPRPMVRHRFQIGIQSDLAAVDARLADMAQARAEGLREAAAELRREAAAYDNPRIDGPCKHVLRHSLMEAAKKVEALAGKPDQQLNGE